MRFVQQMPNLCAYACLESIFLDRNIKFGQIQLFNSSCARTIVGSSMDQYYINIQFAEQTGTTNLLNTYDFLNKTFDGFYIYKDSGIKTFEIFSKYPNQDVIVIVFHKSNGSPLPWFNHAVRIKKNNNKILVMDPSPEDNCFLYPLRKDNMLEVEPNILDNMRLYENNYAEFFVL
ncbi:MAG: hypothetical protein PHF86_06310 [Candidatus Nanoarchaeia archaeon]|nr:hypothetical protein [Candidatus Nanoarchaeia archaeon]